MTDIAKLDARSGPPSMTHLRAGDAVEVTGRLLPLRDASAARLARAIDSGDRLPVSLDGQILYAVGPSPAKPGQIIGSAGPTTTARMARYFPALFASGVRAVIGKGELHRDEMADRKSTRLNSSHLGISYAVFCLKKKKRQQEIN